MSDGSKTSKNRSNTLPKPVFERNPGVLPEPQKLLANMGATWAYMGRDGP
jgi:hypothetical protein